MTVGWTILDFWESETWKFFNKCAVSPPPPMRVWESGDRCHDTVAVSSEHTGGRGGTFPKS